MTQTINIFYLHDGAQFDAETVKNFRNRMWFHRELWTFERTSGIYNPRWYDTNRFAFNVVNNGNTSELVADAPTLIPCDFQSSGLAWNDGVGNTTVTEFGARYQAVIEKMASNPKIPNKIFLVYSCAEPHYHNDSALIKSLALRFPDSKFITSASGTVDPVFAWEREITKNLPNFKWISRQWYFEQVHERTFVDPRMKRAHVDLEATEPPSHLSDFKDRKTRFVMTMKNQRLHRLMASYFIENDRDILDTCTYTRNFSAEPRMFRALQQQAKVEEYMTAARFYLKGVHEIILEEDIPAHEKVGMIDQLFKSPHKIDLKNCQDDTPPPAWMFNGAGIALVASGEENGWGFIDEKPIIAMLFKKPFLYFGGRGLYEELEQMKFKTFRDYFDLSFSTGKTCYERVSGFYKVVKQEALKGEWEFWSGLDSIKEDVEYNYEWFKSGDFKYDNNNRFFEEILNV